MDFRYSADTSLIMLTRGVSQVPRTVFTRGVMNSPDLTDHLQVAVLLELPSHERQCPSHLLEK